MEQRMAAMAAQYHSELISSRQEEQRQHQLAMEQGIYAQRYAQATVAIGERAVSELQARDYLFDELMIHNASVQRNTLFWETTAKAIHDEAYQHL